MERTKRIILVIFVSMLLQFSGVLHGAIPAQERAALIALYNSTNGDNWTNNSGWKTPPIHTDGFAMPGTEGSWYGVTLSGDNVTSLKLAENQLNGFIPTQIGNLSELQHLDLRLNHLIGGIPLQLDEIKSLKYLLLDYDQPGDKNSSQIVDPSHLNTPEINGDRRPGDQDVLISQAGLPDLAPYQPAGLSNTIIFSNTPGTETDDPIYVNQPVYIDYGAKNMGNADITGGFYVSMYEKRTGSSYEKDVFINAYWSSPLYAGYYFKGRDHSYTFTEAGEHLVRLKLDSLNNVYESNEINNEYTRTVYVNEQPTPDLAPYQPSGWANKIIVSSVSGTNTDNTIYANQAAFIDCSVWNMGNGATNGGFYMEIWDDSTGVRINQIYYSTSLAANYYYNILDSQWIFTGSGWHTIRFEIDADNNISESNETNNQYTRQIYVNPVSTTTPSVTTNSVSSITSNSAVCGGNVTSDGGSTVTQRGVCWSTSSYPTTGNSRTYDGSGTGSFISSITGLSANTTYYVRAYATNSNGTAYGSNMSFTTNPTSPTLPLITTNSVSSITSSSAICGGNVTSDGGATVTVRGVCWSTTSNPTTANSKTTNGSGTGSFTSSISGLSPNTTYYVRAYATNSVGTSYGSNVSFTSNPISPTIPTVTTNSISSITSNSAVCGGNVTSDGGSTVTARGVCWSTTSNPTINNSKTTDGSGIGTFSSSITGLSANTMYYVRAYATNSIGTSYGSNVSFTTGSGGTIPTVTTNSVSSITSNSAVCGGNVTSDGGATVTARGVCWSTSYNPITDNTKTSDGSGTGSFTSNISGLNPKTTYYVRAYATNSKGTSYGSNISFTTGSGGESAPTVTTNSVFSITSISAVCGGNVTSDGGATVTARGVCWSTSSNPTTNNSKTTDGSGTGTFTSSISGLNPKTKYYVRAYATNSIGTSYGSNVSFTTGSGGGKTPTVTTNSVSSITSNSAVCGGNVTSDGGSTVIARGVCWSSSSKPTTANSKTNNGSGTGSFISSISGLNSNTKYYVRAYAANDNGTSYGAEMFFTTDQPGQPIISINRSKLNYRAKENKFTGSQTISVSNSGYGTLNWTASSNAGWLNITPLFGSNSGTITVSVNPIVLLPGTYSGAIIITDSNALNSPQSVSVTLKVYQPGGAISPFGEFSTPPNGATVMSSVPVTGWVLDDIEVTSLKIYNSNSYIGDAVFIEGARPDVEQAYPGYPMNYKAGWGYMLLTNFLPNGGNGTFTLYAKASDIEGNEVTLGSKTIYCDNAHAVKPFGAIDTPLQGGTASGKRYRNWGWVLTPQPSMIPFNGTTIDAWVDGIKLGHPTYNIYRSDVASFFPSYTNSNGAAGYFDIDTTTYSNGLHSIVWVATDSGGNSDGIGSRYFSILNADGTQQCKDASLQDTVLNKRPDYNTLLQVNELSPVDYRPIRFRQGIDLNSELRMASPDNDGMINIEIRELERLEIHLNSEEKTENLPPYHLSGYLIVGDGWRELPIGSTLDAGRGIFYWQPGPGFIGEYQLLFVTGETDVDYTKRYITVTIIPRFKK